MIIDGHTITRMLNEGKWKAYRDEKLITAKDLCISPNSVDITLGHKMLIPQSNNDEAIDPVDFKDNISWSEILPDAKGKFYILPGQFRLATVRERFDVAATLFCGFPKETSGYTNIGFHVAPMFEGKSTMARLGLAMHVTAGMGHYGFDGHFTMELVNHGPLAIVLTVGMRIAQLSFQAVTPDVVNMRYCGAYANHESGPNPPKLGRDRFMQPLVT